MMKDKKITTRTIVAAGLGTALFLVLFMFVKIPTPVPNTYINIAYGLSAFFGALYGPLCSAIMTFAGHALTDAICYGTCSWSWIIASFVAGLIQGLSYSKTNIKEREKPTKAFYIINLISHAIAWLIVAPILQSLMYATAIKLAFLQGLAAFGLNIIATLIFGSILCITYSNAAKSKNSLEEE